jgi:hypothetical protein
MQPGSTRCDPMVMDLQLGSIEWRADSSIAMLIGS